MMAADLLHATMRALVLSDVLSDVSSPCRRACSANASALHFALHFWLHSAPASGAPLTAWLAADSLRVAVQPILLLDGSLPRSNVQVSCLERGWPAALIVLVRAFAGALAAGAAAAPGRSCRERELEVRGEANAEGKIEGCGTTVHAKPVCTWVGRGTRPRAASCRPQPPCLAVIGNSVCRIRSGALGLSGAAS